MDLTFDLCVSLNRYEHKPTQEESAKMKFERKTVSIDEMLALVMQGYAYCAVMKHNHHSDPNFISSQTITFDIDDSKVEMNAYIDALPFKPTFAYTSSSNGLEDKGFRFRLVYVLDNAIASASEYRKLTRAFAKQLNLKHVDTHSYVPSQFWFGCCNCESYSSHNIMLKNAINANAYVTVSNNTCNTKEQKYHKLYNYNKSHHNRVSDTFQSDYEKLSFQDFIKKYMNVYANIEHSALAFDEDTPIIQYPKDYYEIRRPWQKINGETLKIKDGEGRRRKLFINGIIRRKINPQISFENLLYNLVYEFEYYCINNGNTIDKKTLYDIAENVMKAEINDSNLGKPKYKSFVNPIYCQKHNMTKQQVWVNAKSKQQFIGEFYDPSLTDKENIDVMKEYGLEISLVSLKRWRKAQGITKYKKS